MRKVIMRVGIIGVASIIINLIFIILAFIAIVGPSLNESSYQALSGGVEMEEDVFAEDMAANRSAEFEPAAVPQAENIAFDADDVSFIEQEALPQQQQERLIIRTGNISIDVEDTIEVQEEIEAIVQRYADAGAFVVSSSESGNRGDRQPSISMAIRVPSSEFEIVMDEIAGLGVEVNFREQSGQDVTEEFVDLQARIESLEIARDRLLEIIEEAQTTEELLLAEQQLTQREAELESLKGRAQFLQESAQLSSISVQLEPFILNQPIDNRWNPSVTVRRAVDGFIDGFQGLVDFLIIFLISVLPFLVVFGGILYFVIRVVVRLARRRRARKPAEEIDEEN